MHLNPTAALRKARCPPETSIGFARNQTEGQSQDQEGQQEGDASHPAIIVLMSEPGPLFGDVKLTAQVKAGGCASKLSPRVLDQVLSSLPSWPNDRVLVGFQTSDDAGVYQISPELALVQTVDFFTPIVDDPFTFGQIAATNSLSDVYAMGGRPL